MIASDRPTGRSGRRALIAARAATWPAVMPVGERVHLLGEHDVAEAVARDAGRGGGGLERGPLEVADELGQVDPAEQPGQVGLVHGDGDAIRSPKRSMTVSQ